MTKEKNTLPSVKLDPSFLKLRSIVISEDINGKIAATVIGQALALEKDSGKKPIRVFINSPGGEMSSGFAIFDVLKFVTCPIHTIVCGLAASMGSIISLAGDRDRVFCLPNARIMIHQPSLGGVRGNVSDLKIHAEEIKKIKRHVIELYREKTKKTRPQIADAIERDNWFSASEALKYGLIDTILSTRNELEKIGA